MRDKEIRRPVRREPGRWWDPGKWKGQAANGNTDGEGAEGIVKLGMANVVFEDCILISKCFPSPGLPVFRKVCGTHGASVCLESFWRSLRRLFYLSMGGCRNGLWKLAPDGKGIGENEHIYQVSKIFRGGFEILSEGSGLKSCSFKCLWEGRHSWLQHEVLSEEKQRRSRGEGGGNDEMA